jgi:hypothetical protein
MKTKLKNNNRICYTTNNLFDSIKNRLVVENQSNTILVPHVCNNINAFGAGFTFHIQNHFPIVKENFHLLGKQATLGYTQLVIADTNKKTDSKIIFANMIAQNGTISKTNPRPIDYAALMRCMMKVKAFIDHSKSDSDTKLEIHAPKFGCGLAGGNWNFISDLIEDIWGDQTVVVYEYKK